MASAFITYSYQINFESVLMIHDHEGMLNMFKALEASGLRRFLGCESVLYEKELGHFFDTALIQGEDVTGVISGKFVSISPTLFAKVFDLPTEGITNFSEVPKDTLYDARSLFSKEDSFDSVTVERFQMMTAIHYGLKVNWSKVLFNVLKDMVDRSQRKAKGFAAQIDVLLKGMPTSTMGNGVPFPSAKILSMRTVHTYIATNITIDARAENEEPGMAKMAVEKKTPKAKKKTSSVDETPVDIFAEIAATKKRSATEADAPIISKKRRTRKSKPSVSQVNLDIVQVAPDVEPLQIVDPTHARDLGDLQEVVLTDVEEVDLVSSDVSTVYRSPSPFSPAVDSFENDWRFSLGPAIFSRVEQEERLYFVQSPESPPAISPHHASSSSSIDVSMHFDSTDIPVNDEADTQASASVDFTMFTEALEDLRSSLAQRIHDSNCEILSKVNAVELGVRGDLLKMQVLLRQSFETACRVLERQGTTQTTQITDLKKGLMAPVGTIFQDLFDIKKKQREQDAKLITMDGQISAIRSEHLDFQSKIAADILSLSTQVCDIADYLRGGGAKKGEIGSSSRPSTVRTQTQTFPPTTGTFEERVEQARRHIIETGQVISIEEAAERVIEADRRESDRLERERERERRERRQSRSGTYKRRRGY
ncbi:hypothetical protein F511_18754 [Dorcoceras hygrometricum]|uniref:Delphilin-like n=1 Tax=Dorcoceras hygrometricum TaxID=472368 RepID=A0A2Z7DFM1_9LAMI|nr:hypothetical protein F511_18754 [Dorcoceras hygrometricum]